MNLERKKTREKSAKKKWKKYVLAFFFLLLAGGIAYGTLVISHLNKTLDKIHEPVERTTEKRKEQVSLKKNEPFSVLLLGVDERANDKGRSDSMIVVTVNPNVKSMKMLSIPRDTYVDIVGKGMKDKINHAYAYGDVEMALDTVEEFLDIPIDYYVKVNMEGFKEIVDALGGITVYNDMELTAGGYHFPEGEIELDGEKALAFSRIRYEDPRGDFGRQIRQKEIISNIIDKGASISSLWKYKPILDALGNNLKTNLTFDEMVKIQQEYADTRHNIEQLNFQSKGGGFIGKIWYYFPEEEEVLEFQNILKEHLELNNA